MKRKTFVGLILILAVLAGATAALYMYAGSTSVQDVRMGQPLFDNLDVNAIAVIQVQTPDQSFSVAKKDGKWQVVERGGYAADFDKVARFGRKMLALTVGRAFPYDAAALARLSLKKPGATSFPKEEMGALFTLLDEKGDKLAVLLVGKEREKPTPEGYPMPAGQYVRTGEMDKVYLVDRFFEPISQNPSDWVKKAIIQVEKDKVASIVCMEIKDGKQSVRYELSRTAPLEAFALSDGRPVKPAETDKLAEALSALTMEDVRKAGAPAADSGVFIDYWLFDGTRYRVCKTETSGDACEVRLEVTFHAPVSSQDQGKEGEGGDQALAKAAADQNKELAPWAFTLSKWRCTTLATDAASLLEEEKPQQ